MKSITYCLFALIVIAFPSLSPGQDVGDKTLISQSRKTEANIGKCDIAISYHSPSVNGRKIFGGIVPYDFVVDGVEYPWRAGSNQRTTFDLSHDVTIEGKPLAAGSYGFIILVSEKEWTLIFSKGKSWGAFNYDPANDVLRIPVKVKTVLFQEWLSYEFLNPKAESVDIELRWETTSVIFKIETNATSNILNDLSAKEEKDANDYIDLAIWTLDENRGNTNNALDLLDRSLQKAENEEREEYRNSYQFAANMMKADLLLENGRTKEGEELKRQTLASAKGFNIYYYSLRKYSVEGKKNEAFDILQEEVESKPDNFQNHFAFGEYYLYERNQEKALEHFQMAYNMTLEQESRWINYARYLYLQNKLILERASSR